MRLIWLTSVISYLAIPMNSDAISCLQCTSVTSGCNQGAQAPTACPQEDDTCYTQTISDGFELERGCLSLLPEADQAKCYNTTDHTCQICAEVDGCNREQWSKCHQCNKSTNEKCAFAPNRILFCRRYNSGDRCYAKVEGSELIRGCVSDLEDAKDPCEGNKYCTTCVGDACNSETQNDLKTVARCVQCKEGEFRCVDGSTANSECDEREDKCYIKMWKDGELDRGCLNKLSQEEQTRCNDESDRSCFSCFGKACNHHRWLKCYQCDPVTNVTCADEQTNTTLSFYCANFQVNDRCYAKLADFEVTRGCGSDLGIDVDPCAGNSNCVTCSSDACNFISEAYLKNPRKTMKNNYSLKPSTIGR